MLMTTVALLAVLTTLVLAATLEEGSQEALGQGLMTASGEGNRDKVAHLLEQGASPTTRNQYGETALHTACMQANPDVVELLLAAGADANAETDGEYPGHDLKVRRTPLMWCVHAHNSLPAVRALLRGGASVSTIQSEEGQTVLDMVKGMGEAAIQNGLLHELIEHASTHEGLQEDL